MSKTYILVKERNGMESRFEGSLDELTDKFSYTLECGNSWNKRISRRPKTIKSLVTNINNAFAETERGYTRSSVRLA
jgi:hypothetical protein